MILAIDATNWIHVLWHARVGKGLLNALAARIEAVAESLRAAHVVACFDAHSFRHDLWFGYKANRPERPQELTALLVAAPDACMAVATIAREEGFEADDLLASLARLGPQIGHQVVLATPDKDCRQCLVDGQVSILRQFSVNGNAIVKPEWLTARSLKDGTGVSAQQWPDYQALCGDPGDGIEGCPGFGPKTAAACLQKAGTLAECFRDPWQLPITMARQTALTNFRKRADLVLRLVTLRTDSAAVVDAIR